MNRALPSDTFDLDLTGIAAGTTLTIGRSEQCDLVINDPEVSAEHLKITVEEDGVFIRDLQSRRGITINRQPFRGRRRLYSGDLISLPGRDFVVRLSAAEPLGCRVDLEGLTVTAASGKGGKTLLQDISLTILPGEFVGIIGPSGCGKSTLIKALTGTIVPSGGKIRFNGHIADAAELRARTGYLPQAVIVEDCLTPTEILDDAHRLYLVHSDPDHHELLATVGLEAAADQPVITLSGGQQKRTGLAQELLFSPGLLGLDEVTSGLDPQSERDLMQLFRQLADRGQTLLCVTHYPERLVWCDKLIILQNGRLRFFGTPAETVKYFEITGLEQLYDELSARDWPPVAGPPPNEPERQPAEPPPKTVNFRRQLLGFAIRYGRIMLRSPEELTFNVSQGLLIGLLIGFCFGTRSGVENTADLAGRDVRLIFALVLAAIWTGAAAAIREIVKERILLRHEGRRGIAAFSYLAAKFTILLLPAWIAVLLVLATVAAWTGLRADFPSLGGILLLTSAMSVALGLLLSAWSATQEKALLLLPVAIIALIMFSDGIQPLKGTGVRLARSTCYAYWAYQAARNTLEPEPISAVTDPLPPAKTNADATFATSTCLLIMFLHFLVFAGLARLGMRRLLR